jgi:AmiR/NasT family two-component response regulator
VPVHDDDRKWSHPAVLQAEGVLIVRHHITAVEAADLMACEAGARGVSITEVAETIVANR